jgi:putative redox protein
MATIEASLGSGYQVEILANGHRWLGDEPVEVGGDDTGPTPYELLLGALAACTCMTIAMYAKRKDWELEGVSVRYTHNKVHADDCDECEDDATGYLDRVESQITITGRFDDDQRARLEQVAKRCPVHKTLEKGMTIVDHVHVSDATA